MSARLDNAEIVEVITDCRLIDAESYECVYWRRNGKGLPRGFYVVRWPAGAHDRRYHEDSVFEGPYERREQAAAALDSADDAGEGAGGVPPRPGLGRALVDALSKDLG